MNNSMKFLVKKRDDGKRLDIFLSEKIKHLTRSNIKKIIESKNVKINKKIADSSSKKVKINDEVIIELLIKNSIIISSFSLTFFEEEIFVFLLIFTFLDSIIFLIFDLVK